MSIIDSLMDEVSMRTNATGYRENDLSTPGFSAAVSNSVVSIEHVSAAARNTNLQYKQD